MAATKKSSGRPTAITSLKDTDSRGKRNWLIYGKSGDGKTVLAGTAPKALFLTVEAAGTESAKGMGSTADEWVIPTKKDLDTAYDYFANGTGCQDYEWVLLDSLSEIEELFWSHVQGEKAVKRIQDYGTIETMIKREVDRWNRLPINVLYTAGMKSLDMEDEDGEEYVMNIPSLGTKNGVMAQVVCAKTTLNGLLVVRTTKDEDGNRQTLRRLYLRGSRSFVAKDRHMLAEDKGFIPNPNIEKMAAVANRLAAVDNTKKEGA